MLYHHTLPAALLLATTAAHADTPLVVVTDIAPIHSLTAQVMKGVAEPQLLVGPSDSPHNFALRPSQARALQDATAAFWIGPELTPWLEKPLAELMQSGTAIALLDAPGAVELDFRDGPIFGNEHGEGHEDHGHDDEKHDDHDDHDDHAEEGHDDHSDHDHDKHADEEHAHDEDKHDDHAKEGHEGHDEHDEDKEAKHDDHDDHAHDEHAHDEDKHDDHAEEAGHDDHAGHDHDGVDPHGWLSPDNAAVWLTVIADSLSEIAPEHADTFRANAATAKDELAQIVTEITATLEPVQGQKFLVFHDAFQYFEAHFGLNSLGSVALSDATAPSPKRIEELRAHLREDAPACAFSEPQLNTRLLDTVLEGEGVKVSTLDPHGSAHEPGPDLYGNLLRNMANSFATCAD